MTDTSGGTEPLDRTAVQREAAATPPPVGVPAASGPVAAGGPQPSSPQRDPVAAVKDPDNRAKLLLGIAALALLNFLLLLAVLANVLDDGPDPVTVDGRACIIRDHAGESRLFCAD